MPHPDDIKANGSLKSECMNGETSLRARERERNKHVHVLYGNSESQIRMSQAHNTHTCESYVSGISATVLLPKNVKVNKHFNLPRSQWISSFSWPLFTSRFVVQYFCGFCVSPNELADIAYILVTVWYVAAFLWWKVLMKKIFKTKNSFYTIFRQKKILRKYQIKTKFHFSFIFILSISMSCSLFFFLCYFYHAIFVLSSSSSNSVFVSVFALQTWNGIYRTKEIASNFYSPNIIISIDQYAIWIWD